jgi:hypothetical protein
VTDVLADYVTERGVKLPSARVIGCAVEAMTPYWAGRTLADVTPQTCEGYADWRSRSENTIRRELNVLATAVNWQFKNGRITRPVAVLLPPKPQGKMRWLTHGEVDALLRAAHESKRARSYLPHKEAAEAIGSHPVGSRMGR